MNIIELKEQLESFDNDDTGIIVYFVLKDDTETIVKKADIENEKALPELKRYYLDSIRTRIINQEDISLLNISESDERKDVIYRYDLDDIPSELSIIQDILQDQMQTTFRFNQDSISDIKGYVILIGDQTSKLLLYKQHYAISLIKRDSFLFYKANERFVRLNEDLIRLDDNFQFFSLNGELFIKDLNVLERFFGFHDAIKREAVLSVESIEDSGILEDVEVLKESIEDITFARKLTRLSTNSPVLGNIPVPTIIEFSKSHPGIAGKFKYNQDESKIRLDTKKSQNLFVKLLKDSYLKSELTNMYYDSLAKDIILKESV